MATPNPKISDAEAVLKKQAAAIRAAIETLRSAVKVEKKSGGKDITVDENIVKKAVEQYRAACAAAGHYYELMKQWFERGKNAAMNDLEKAGAEWAKAKKEVESIDYVKNNPMIKMLKGAPPPPAS